MNHMLYKIYRIKKVNGSFNMHKINHKLDEMSSMLYNLRDSRPTKFLIYFIMHLFKLYRVISTDLTSVRNNA